MEPTSQPSTMLCFCEGEAPTPQTVLGDVGKSRRGEGKKKVAVPLPLKVT